MRHRFYAHLIWTTRDRAPLIDASAATLVTRIVRQAARTERGRLLAIGIVTTHVHALVSLHPLSVVPRMLQRTKGASGHLVNRDRRPAGAPPLQWAAGYTIEIVSPRALEAARIYIRGQATHHPAEAIPGWRPPRLGIEAMR